MRIPINSAWDETVPRADFTQSVVWVNNRRLCCGEGVQSQPAYTTLFACVWRYPALLQAHSALCFCLLNVVYTLICHSAVRAVGRCFTVRAVQNTNKSVAKLSFLISHQLAHLITSSLEWGGVSSVGVVTRPPGRETIPFRQGQ
jgi:hypothetical protein